MGFRLRLFQRDPGPPTAKQLFYARIESARAAGKWTDEVQSIWNQLGDPGERFTAGDAERLDDLKHLLTENGE